MMARDYSDDYSAGPPVGPLLIVVAVAVLVYLVSTVGVPAARELAAFVRTVAHLMGQ